jgi:hypothetical protein
MAETAPKSSEYIGIQSLTFTDCTADFKVLKNARDSLNFYPNIHFYPAGNKFWPAIG